MDLLLCIRRVDPVHQSPRAKMYGYFTHGTVPPSRLYSSGVFSLPHRLRRLPSPTHFRSPSVGAQLSLGFWFYTAVRLLTEGRSLFRFRLWVCFLWCHPETLS